MVTVVRVPIGVWLHRRQEKKRERTNERKGETETERGIQNDSNKNMKKWIYSVEI